MPPTAPGAIGSVSCGCVSRSSYFHKALWLGGIGPGGRSAPGPQFMPVGAAQPGSVASFSRNRRFRHFNKLTVRDFAKAFRSSSSTARLTTGDPKQRSGVEWAPFRRVLHVWCRRLLFRRRAVSEVRLFPVIAEGLDLRAQHRAFHHPSAHLARGVIKLIRDRSALRPQGAACFDRARRAGKQDVVHGATIEASGRKRIYVSYVNDSKPAIRSKIREC
jgi:hypothetical protein